MRGRGGFGYRPVFRPHRPLFIGRGFGLLGFFFFPGIMLGIFILGILARLIR
jgi:hypothetical protein